MTCFRSFSLFRERNQLLDVESTVATAAAAATVVDVDPLYILTVRVSRRVSEAAPFRSAPRRSASRCAVSQRHRRDAAIVCRQFLSRRAPAVCSEDTVVESLNTLGGTMIVDRTSRPSSTLLRRTLERRVQAETWRSSMFS